MNTVNMMIDISDTLVSRSIGPFQGYSEPIIKQLLRLLDCVVGNSVSIEPAHESSIDHSYCLGAELIIFEHESRLKLILLSFPLP